MIVSFDQELFVEPPTTKWFKMHVLTRLSCKHEIRCDKIKLLPTPDEPIYNKGCNGHLFLHTDLMREYPVQLRKLPLLNFL